MIQRKKVRQIFRVRQMIGREKRKRWDKWKRLDICLMLDKWWGETNKKGQTLFRQMIQRKKFIQILRVRQMIRWEKG